MPMSENLTKLDEIIHQPVRTRIIAFLINSKGSDYVTLKIALGLSDGHMSTHMKVLVNSGYVNMTKAFVANKPKTTYEITDKGKKQFKQYLENLKTIIEG